MTKKLSCSDGHPIDACFIEFSQLLQLERCSLPCIALPAAAPQKRRQQLCFRSQRTRSFQMRALPDRFPAATLRTGTLDNVAHRCAAATAIPQALWPSYRLQSLQAAVHCFGLSALQLSILLNQRYT